MGGGYRTGVDVLWATLSMLGCAAGIGGVVALLVWGARVGRRRERARLARIAAWAAGTGFQPLPVATGNRWLAWLRAPSDKVTLVLGGPHRGRPTEIAEYQYTVNNGKTSHTVRYVLVAARVHGQYPFVSVAERGIGSSLWRSLAGPGGTEIGQPAFDSRFRIRTELPELGRRLLRPQLVSAMLANQVPAWYLVGAELIALYRGRIAPETIGAQLDCTCWIADQVEAPALPTP